MYVSSDKNKQKVFGIPSHVFHQDSLYRQNVAGCRQWGVCQGDEILKAKKRDTFINHV
jgi:hypothetical protein